MAAEVVHLDTCHGCDRPVWGGVFCKRCLAVSVADPPPPLDAGGSATETVNRLVAAAARIASTHPAGEAQATAVLVACLRAGVIQLNPGWKGDQ